MKLYIPSEYFQKKALKVGFDDCGVASLEAIPLFMQRYSLWLKNGFNADMSYLEKYLHQRENPRMLMEEGMSVVSVVLSYNPPELLQNTSTKVARYAYWDDYHKVLKQKLWNLIAEIKEDYPSFEAKPFVDTAPISDKVFALKAGLGWIGKNTQLISPRWGSFVNIGEIICNAESDYPIPMESQCGECELCIKSCPNGALSELGLDARKCTSYNTIENRADNLPEKLKTKGFSFGCDICQEVCPKNMHIPVAHRNDSRKEDLLLLENCSEKEFKKLTKNSAMDRISYSQWRRNIKKSKEKE